MVCTGLASEAGLRSAASRTGGGLFFGNFLLAVQKTNSPGANLDSFAGPKGKTHGWVLQRSSAVGPRTHIKKISHRAAIQSQMVAPIPLRARIKVELAMKLLTISVGSLEWITHGERQVPTGIYKRPVDGVQQVTVNGLIADEQVDLENHGGPDKAIYVYTQENYDYWQAELGRELGPGQFGENFTVAGMPDEAVHIGDQFRCGELLLQVTQPRVPCFKLGIRMGDKDFVGRFHHSGRVGFYLRVLETGSVEAGTPIEPVSRDPAALNIREAMLALTKGPRQQEIIAQALAIDALSEAWRQSLAKRQS
jgi:MOSC domain-containing protein YiiM